MKPATPSRNIDEHDIVFARMRLKPGTLIGTSITAPVPGS
jgi:hypothetical protein